MKCPHSFVIPNKDYHEKMEYANPLDIVSGVTVPCGTCVVCRRNRASEWSTRLQHELPYHQKSAFITLTYSNENLPVNGFNMETLCKRDFQLFMKRLRKELYPDKIKYFACGEYGSKTERPHYHAILFGWSPENLVKHGYGDNITFSDKTLSRIWDNGQVTVGSVTSGSIHYVTGYILKANLKKTALMAREKEFILSSQGLGKQYCLDYAEELSQLINVTRAGTTSAIPRLYIDWLGKELYKTMLDDPQYEDIDKEKLKALAKSKCVDRTKALKQTTEKQYALLKKFVKTKEFKSFSLENRQLTLRLVQKARKQNEMNVTKLLNLNNANVDELKARGL